MLSSLSSCLGCSLLLKVKDAQLLNSPSNANANANANANDLRRRLTQSRTPKQVKQVHAQILRHGLASDPTLLANLIRLYSSPPIRRLDLASKLFSHFHFLPKATFAWNLIIRAHATNGFPLDSLLLYTRMISSGIPPDKFTFPFVITACSALSSPYLTSGMQVHAHAIKSGRYNDLYLHNALIHFYFTCRRPDYGRKVFDTMRVRSVVSWTALLSGLIACGKLHAALEVFDIMPTRNVITWTAMIDGCSRNGRPDLAFRLFQKMQADNVRPNEFTLVSMLIACTELGSLSLGRWVHDFAHRIGGLETEVYVGTALIDMYSKCGSLDDAIKVFDQMPVRSLPTWNSMITSFGVHGLGRRAVELFREMEKEKVRPDEITLVGVLCACLKEGMAEEGFTLFRYMCKHYGIVPGIEHYRCLVELVGTVDVLDTAVRMMKATIAELEDEACRTLVMACRDVGNLKVEEIVCDLISELEMSEASASSQNHCFEWEVGE